MNVQSYLKKYIKDNGGLDYFLGQLDLIKPLFKTELKYKINDIKMYMYMLHHIDIDMENETIGRKDSFMLSLNEFKDIYNRTGSLFAKLMIGMYEYGFDKTDKIKNIS